MTLNKFAWFALCCAVEIKVKHLLLNKCVLKLWSLRSVKVCRNERVKNKVSVLFTCFYVFFLTPRCDFIAGNIQQPSDMPHCDTMCFHFVIAHHLGDSFTSKYFGERNAE